MENQTQNGKNIAESSIFKKILGQAEEYFKKPLRVKELLNNAYKKASEKKDVGTIAHEVWESLQILSRLIKAAVTGEYTGIPTSTIIGGIAVLLYFLTPIDFVPDFIPVIGLLDDVALLAWYMTSIKTEMDKFQEWERSNQSTTAATGNAAAPGIPTGLTQTSGMVDPSPSTAKDPAYTNEDRNTPEKNRPDLGGGHHVPLSKAGEEVIVKDFTAHDLDTSQDPNDSAIRATSSGSGEPNVRAATTDGTRIPNSNDGDARTGGNVR
jgi:uncharacterized membrane protein YkvA (DUF1232 family)